jgi:hypothetical protein
MVAESMAGQRGDRRQRERDAQHAGGEDDQVASVRSAVTLMFIGLVVTNRTMSPAGWLAVGGDDPGHPLTPGAY